MLNAESLSQDFSAHVERCPSGIFACSVRAAFEAWFQVELAFMLSSSGRFESVETGYDYPDGGKGDLQAKDQHGLIVFELKCFVCGADANKKRTWPGQLARLSRVVEEEEQAASQGVAVSTYFGYDDKALSRLVNGFHPPPWDRDRVGPRTLFADAPLQFVIATVIRQSKGNVDEVQRAGPIN